MRLGSEPEPHVADPSCTAAPQLDAHSSHSDLYVTAHTNDAELDDLELDPAIADELDDEREEDAHGNAAAHSVLDKSSLGFPGFGAPEKH